MIRLLKIPGNWKDLLYTSRNVHASAFHEGSPSGISGSFMGVLNICFHPLSVTKLSLYMHQILLMQWSCQAVSSGDWRRERQLTPVKRRRTWLGGACPGVVLKGHTKFGHQNHGCKSPRQGPKDTVSRCPQCDTASATPPCSISSLGAVFPPPWSSKQWELVIMMVKSLWHDPQLLSVSPAWHEPTKIIGSIPF